MSDQLRLAKLLGQQTPAGLAQLLRQSSVADRAFDNLLDLSGYLLQRKQLISRLSDLHRSDLQSLVADQTNPTLIERFVADAAGPLAGARELVAKLLQEKTSQIPPDEQAIWSERPPELVAQGIGQSMIALRELILSSERHWLKVMRQGLRKPDAVAFSEYIHFSSEDIQQLFGLATSMGLIRQEDDRWVASDIGLSWVSLSDQAAWAEVIAALSPDLNQLSGVEPGVLLVDFLQSEFPLLAGDKNRVARFGNLLGLAEQGRATGVLKQILLGHFDSTLSELSRVWPTPTEKIIVQADQSVTVAGPIPGWLHLEFAGFSDAIDIGLASRFRLSKLSICRGLEAGLTAGGIAKRLRELSGNDLPQPVLYLLDDAERNLMNIRVGSSGFGSVVDFTDRIDSLQLERDRALNPLSLFRTSDTQLGSRLKRDIVWLAIRDAGYVAVRVGPEGNPITWQRSSSQPAEQVTDSTLEVANRLLQTNTPELDEQNLIKQLQFAQKNRLTVQMSIRVANGDQLSFAAVVTGVSETRVRVRDAVADTERTLPLTSILEWTLG